MLLSVAEEKLQEASEDSDNDIESSIASSHKKGMSKTENSANMKQWWGTDLQGYLSYKIPFPPT